MKEKRREESERDRTVVCWGAGAEECQLPTASPFYSEVVAAASAIRHSLSFVQLIYKTRILALLS